MNSLMHKKDLKKYNIIKDVRNLFRQKKEINNSAIKDIRNLFKWKKNEAIKDRIVMDIKNVLSRIKKIITNQ